MPNRSTYLAHFLRQSALYLKQAPAQRPHYKPGTLKSNQGCGQRGSS